MGADAEGVERRACERVVPPELDNDLRVRLDGPDGDRVEAEIVDLSYSGVGLRLPAALAPAVERRGEVPLYFEDLRGGVIPPIVARLRSSVQTATTVRLGMDFAPMQDLSRDLPAHLLALFNRRAARRIAPRDPVVVELEPDGEPTSIASLRDISWTGAGVELPVTASLERLQGVELRFDLPGVERRFRLRGDVQYDLLVDDVVRLGIHFDPKASEDFAAQQASLKRYVATCHLAHAREIVGAVPGPESGSTS